MLSMQPAAIAILSHIQTSIRGVFSLGDTAANQYVDCSVFASYLGGLRFFSHGFHGAKISHKGKTLKI
jgi:hypothetical protein